MQNADNSGIGPQDKSEKSPAFFGTVIVMACAGLFYAVAETYSMGICGLRIGALGVLTHGILFFVVGAILGLCFCVLWALYDRFDLVRSCRSMGVEISSSSLFAGTIALGYLAIVTVWAAREISAKKVLCLVLFVVVLFLVLWLTKRRFISVAGTVAVIFLLPFIAGPMIASAEFGGELSIAMDRAIFAAWAIAPVSVLFVTLIFFGRTKNGEATDSKSMEEWKLLAVVVPAAFIAYLGVWASCFLPLEREWSQIINREDVVLRNTQTSTEGRPNVLIIVLDTVRADHLDLFGYERKTMPRLTKFANRERTVSAQIPASSPSTLATHGSLFTGMYPVKHGAHKPFLSDDNPPVYAYHLRDSIKTLAERLQ